MKFKGSTAECDEDGNVWVNGVMITSDLKNLQIKQPNAVMQAAAESRTGRKITAEMVVAMLTLKKPGMKEDVIATKLHCAKTTVTKFLRPLDMLLDKMARK